MSYPTAYNIKAINYTAIKIRLKVKKKKKNKLLLISVDPEVFV